MSNLTHPNYFYTNHFEPFVNYTNQDTSNEPESVNNTDNVDSFSNHEAFTNYNEHFINPSDNEDVFVMFYAPWCGHCKNAKPEIQKTLGGIATEYNDYITGNYKKKGKVAVVFVNGDNYPELAKRHDVQGYPTFKMFKGVSDKHSLESNDIMEYDGGRSFSDFEGFLNQDNTEGFTNYTEAFANYDRKVANKDEDVFAMFYAPWCGHCKNAKPEMQKTLGGIATEYDDYLSGNYKKEGNVVVVLVNGDTHPELAKRHDVQGYPTFKMFKGVSDKSSLESSDIMEYDGGRNKEDFEGFLNQDNTEGYTNYNEAFTNYYEKFSNPNEDVFVMFYADWCGHCKTAKPHIQKSLGGIATEYDDYTSGNYRSHNGKSIVLVNADKFPEITRQHGVQGYPTFKYFKSVKGKNLLAHDEVKDYNGHRTSEGFNSFLE
jgi:thiol-disulfide isomerase/thioredoxin